ncbi:MAG: CBS domain-containing protein [Chloroflexota bacterium]|nr:CBS domain-containing protein [Chloroflexota bacterium]
MSTKPELQVRDVMVTEIVSINGLAVVSEAISLMRRHNVKSLVVNRRDENDEIGLVLVSDIARLVIAPNRSPDRVNVYEIMSKPVWTVSPDMLARYAVRLLVRFEVSRAVVVDHDRNPIGMVTLRDLTLG